MSTDKEISEIEKTIRGKIEEERQRGIKELDRSYESAVNKITNVFSSCMKTLEQMKLVDSDLFKYFWKTKGNIKVIEHEPRYSGFIGINLPDGHAGDSDIQLQEKKKYRVILMVTEIEE